MANRKLFMAAWAILLLSGCILVVTGVSVWRRDRTAEAEGFREVLADSRNEAVFLDRQLAAMREEVHRLAQGMAQGSLTPAVLPTTLPAVLGRLPEKVLRLGVELQAGVHREVHWAAREAKEIKYRRLVEAADASPARGPQPPASGWQQPGADTDGRAHPLTCVEPFRLPGPSGRSGLVRLEIDQEALQRDVSGVAAGYDGYGFLLSREGIYLANPREETVRDRRTIAQVGVSLKDRGHGLMAQAALEQREAWAEGKSELTGQPSWILVEPLPAAQWTLGMTVLKTNVVPARTGRSWGLTLTLIMEASLLFLLSAFFLALGPRRTRPDRLWWLSVAGSLLLMGSMVVCWWFAHRSSVSPPGNEHELMDPSRLEAFKEKYALLEAGRAASKATFIPTGLHLLTIDLLGATQVKVSGLAWKKVPKDSVRGPIGGVFFPDALSSQSTESWDLDEGHQVVHRFPFQGTFPVDRGNAASFPFDHAQVEIRFWPWHRAGNEVMVPDLEGYRNLLPSAKPGLERGLDVPGWHLSSSSFAYVPASYETNFGAAFESGVKNYPEMVYQFTMARDWINPFIFAFLPVFLVAGLLFALLMTTTTIRERATAIGYSAMNVIRAVTSLFFPLAVSQFNLRSRIVTEGIIYVEYYYFIMYGMILLVTCNALVVGKVNHPVLAYEDNLAPKLLFWPVLMFSFHLVSLYYLPFA